jgi:homocysteine S-methyltransferase
MLADGSEYRGHYAASDAVLREFHAPRLAVLARAGVDLIACETLPCLREAVILADLLREYAPLTAWISFSCQDDSRNCEGEDVAVCAAALRAFDQVTAIGVNCTAPQFVAGLLRRMGSETDQPLLAYPNSGERYEPATKRWLDGGGPPFATRAEEWLAAGARLIGGCCRTAPADIAAMRAAIIPSF